MASVGVLNAELQLRIDNLMRNADTASKKMQSVANTIQDAFGKTDYIAPLRESMQGLGHDVRSITSGIIIAQTFYQILNAAQAAAGAIWDYTDALNASQVAFGNLFGNYELASEFVAVLQEYATRSPFDFRDVQTAAQSLRAYGIEAENLMFVIQGIGNLASVTGNYSETFNRVARAIGQINTRGKLMGEEMRQLAEAGLNVDAVYQRLGITAGEVTDANISSAEAINAIVDVLNESYGDAVAAANTTMRGILANMRDLALSIISSIIQPVYEGVHSMLYTISQGINEFQRLFNAGGLGNAISQMFGSDVLATLQNFMAIVVQLGQSILQVLYPALRVVGQALLAIITAATPVISVISMLLSILGNLANFLLNNAAAMRILQGVLMALATAFILNRVAAAGMLILQVVSRVIAFFSTVAMAASQALQVMSIYLAAGAGAAVAAGKGWVAFASALNVNPLILAISVIAALIASLIGLRSLLGGVSDVAANMTSFEPSNFLGSIPAASGDINKFNNRLQDTNDQLNDMADGLGNAGKAAEKAVEGLLSFDEVFSLPDANDPTLGGGGLGDIGDIGDIEMPDFGDIGASVPDVPLFNWEDLFGYAQLPDVWGMIVDWFKGLEWPDITGYISSGLISAISSIGADTIALAFMDIFSGGFSASTLTGYLTNPKTWTSIATGLKNGLKAGILSMGFDFVFDTIAQGLRDSGNSTAGNIVDAVSNPIANALGTAIVTKNPFAAAGAGVASAIFGSIQTGVETGDWSSTVSNVLGGIGGVFTKFKAGSPAGMFLGFGSTISDGIFGAISQSLEESGNTEGAEIASHAGDIISMALSGASIGAAFGPVGAAVGAGVGGILGTIGTFWDDISAWWTNDAWPWLSGLGSDLLSAGGDIMEGLGQGLEDGWNGATEFFGGIGDTIGGFFTDADNWLTTTGGSIIDGLKGGAETAWSNVSGFFGGLGSTIQTDVSDAGTWLTTTGDNIIDGLRGGAETAWNTASSFFGGLGSTVQGLVSGAGDWLTSTGSSIIDGLRGGAETAWSTASSFFSGLPDTVSGFFSGAGTLLSAAGNSIVSGLQSGAETAWNPVSSWFGGLPDGISNVFSGAASWLTTPGNRVIEGLKGGAQTAWTTANSWLGGLPNSIRNTFSGGVSWLTNPGNKIMSGLKNGMTAAWNSARSWISGLRSTITNLFSGASNWLSRAGRSITDGLWSGLRSGWDWITSQVSSWGRTLANIKGPESYDKKLLVPNGEWITEGLLTGLTNKIPEVMDLMSGLAPMMAEEFSSNAGMTIQSAQPHNTGYNTGNRDNTTTVANPYLNQQDTVDNRPVVYVRTMIADKQGLRELKKQLDIVSAESDRWR